MADIGVLKVVVDASDLEAQTKKYKGMGFDVTQKFGGEAGKAGQPAMLQISGAADKIATAASGLKAGTRYAATLPTGGGVAGAGISGFADRLKNTFTMKNAKEMNKSLFMLQMSSLGVAFSFMSIIGMMTGMFAGLADLGTMISTGAIGTAFAGIATGGEGTNIAQSMGVTTDMQVAAWAGFTAIVSQFKAVFDALAVKVLTPEMVAAILAVIDAIAITLADPGVVKALQEIIKAVLEIVLAFLPLIPVIADVVAWLGETGLLKFLLLIIVAAEILLPTLAYLQFIFTAVMTAVTFLTGAATLLSVPLWAIITVIGVIVFAVMFLMNVLTNLQNGMDLASAITNAFGQTIAQFVNILIGAYNTVASIVPFLPKAQMWATTTGAETETYTRAQTTVNNITFARSVGVQDKTQIANAVQSGLASTYG